MDDVEQRSRRDLRRELLWLFAISATLVGGGASFMGWCLSRANRDLNRAPLSEKAAILNDNQAFPDCPSNVTNRDRHLSWITANAEERNVILNALRSGKCRLRWRAQPTNADPNL